MVRPWQHRIDGLYLNARELAKRANGTVNHTTVERSETAVNPLSLIQCHLQRLNTRNHNLVGGKLYWNFLHTAVSSVEIIFA